MIDPLVSNLNDLNRALPRVENAMMEAGRLWRKSLRDSDLDAIRDWAAVVTEVSTSISNMRRMLAKECDPWFEKVAFALPHRPKSIGERMGDLIVGKEMGSMSVARPSTINMTSGA